MQKPQLIAGTLTALLVAGTMIYLFGEELQFGDLLKDAKEWVSFSQSESTATKKTKTSSKKGKVARSTSKPIDSYKGVKVYDNGSVRNVHGRNTTTDGYNLGLKYQCVEFVKRFYYEHYGHKMPNSYGHAKEFFNPGLADGSMNRDRGLIQYKNPSSSKPRPNDILVFGSAPYNSFGHVAIISKVESNRIQIIQQNPGPGNPSREYLNLTQYQSAWKVDEPYIVGWLRKP